MMPNTKPPNPIKNKLELTLDETIPTKEAPINTNGIVVLKLFESSGKTAKRMATSKDRPAEDLTAP